MKTRKEGKKREIFEVRDSCNQIIQRKKTRNKQVKQMKTERYQKTIKTSENHKDSKKNIKLANPAPRNYIKE